MFSRIDALFLRCGRAEGLSFLLLLLVAMPLKYLADMPIAVKIVGMIHGILFVAYGALAVMLSYEEQWSKKKLFMSLLCSVLPLGTFYFERTYHDVRVPPATP